MFTIPTRFARHWSVRVPSVYRQLPKKYIDQFFEDGTLQLSTFEAFRNHKDEIRRDTQEGTSSVQITTPNGAPLTGLMVDGPTSYILCFYSNEPTNEQIEQPETAFLHVTHTTNFALAVSRHIPEYNHGYEGPCIYADELLVRKRGNRDFDAPGESEEEIERFMEQMRGYLADESRDSYFRKLKKFAHEDEYRLLWLVSHQVSKDPIKIKCPEARQFCERVDWQVSSPERPS